MENNNSKNNFVPILIISVFFALIAGVVGELLAKTYLINSALNIPLLGEINVSDSNPSMSNFVIREAKKVVVEQNDKTAETANAVGGSIVGIFKKKIVTVKKSFDLDSYYNSKDLLGQGIIITSDGWIVTNSSLISEKPESYKNYVIITKDKTNYQIDKVVADKLTKFYFLHVVAKDLPVRKFANPVEFKNGQLVLSVSYDSSVILSSMVNAKKVSDLVGFSDKFSDELVLLNNLSKEWRGPAVFDFAGDIVGLINEDGKIESFGHLNSAITSLFKYKEIRRSSLGVNYVGVESLTDIKLQKDSQPNLPNKGAVIVKGLTGVAVVKGSPAEVVGLKEGDIITAVDNIEISQNVNLTDAIENYIAGDKVNITYLQNGVEKEATVVLGEIK